MVLCAKVTGTRVVCANVHVQRLRVVWLRGLRSCVLRSRVLREALKKNMKVCTCVQTVVAVVVINIVVVGLLFL